ncbi:phage tail tube protein [Piscinibacter sakaiensis]|uniref:Phage protein n=1 Tax=Piscinibacter sakaiensis TaxID=1547922 RepID=A0A0K8P8F1_PISS1|nr:phage tail tube protein [Piscinibacter sakaiensis]GAP38784.1 hypothetical protein ISF6_5337 [Piscinibacter sakaiensis]
MPIPLSAEKTAVLVKIEATVGTNALPTGAANAVEVDSISISPFEAKTVDRRPVRPYFGGAKKLTASGNVKVEIEVPLSTSGSPGVVPQWDALMQICAASSTVVATTSVTYAPVSASMKSATVFVNIDGNNHIVTSCRGTWAMTVNAEGVPMLKFSLTGIYNAMAAAALPAVTYTGNAEPLPVNKANTTLSLHAQALVASAFAINLNGNVTYKNRIGDERVDFMGRATDFSATFESVPVGTKDWIAAAQANTTGALSLVHGVGAGKVITVSAAIAQLWTAKYSVDDMIHMTEVTGGLLPGGPNGNNEWSIVLT